jgi:hypothetical protein
MTSYSDEAVSDNQKNGTRHDYTAVEVYWKREVDRKQLLTMKTLTATGFEFDPTSRMFRSRSQVAVGTRFARIFETAVFSETVTGKGAGSSDRRGFACQSLKSNDAPRVTYGREMILNPLRSGTPQVFSGKINSGTLRP